MNDGVTIPVASVDLSAVDEAVRLQDTGIDVDILGLDGKTPLGLKIRVAGPDSHRAQKAQEELADELLEKEMLGKMKAAEAKKRGIRYIARITLGWDPAIKIGPDAPMPYSVSNAEKLYTRFRFIRDQVDAAAGDRARFMNG